MGPTNSRGRPFAPFDPADYLASVDDVVAYLEAVLDQADDDPTLIAEAFGAVARSRNVSELARRAGVSREGLYKALSADGNPSFATVLKVSRALGLRIRFEPLIGSAPRTRSQAARHLP